MSLRYPSHHILAWIANVTFTVTLEDQIWELGLGLQPTAALEYDVR